MDRCERPTEEPVQLPLGAERREEGRLRLLSVAFAPANVSVGLSGPVFASDGDSNGPEWGEHRELARARAVVQAGDPREDEREGAHRGRGERVPGAVHDQQAALRELLRHRSCVDQRGAGVSASGEDQHRNVGERAALGRRRVDRGRGPALQSAALPASAAQLPNGAVAVGARAETAESRSAGRSATGVLWAHGKTPSAQVVATATAGSRPAPHRRSRVSRARRAVRAAAAVLASAALTAAGSSAATPALRSVLTASERSWIPLTRTFCFFPAAAATLALSGASGACSRAWRGRRRSRR